MKLSYLQQVYENPGPFATVYLDTSAGAEDAAKAIELRWRSTRERLAEQGADTGTLDAMTRHISDHEWRTGHRGQILVAQQGEVVLSDELPQPPGEISAEEQAYFGAVPHLMPYLRMRGPRIPHVVAIVDHIGAQIRVVHATQESECTSVAGDDHPVHKTTGDETSEQHFQRSVEEQWKANAALVGEEITKHAMHIGAKAIVLAGDPRQRTLVHEQIGGNVRDTVVETEAGHSDRKASDEYLQHQVAETVDSILRSRVDERVGEFEQQRGEHQRAVEGWQGVREALRREQIQTLLWADRAPESSVDRLSIGPNSCDVGRDEVDLGVAAIGSAPASAAVVRALVGTSAELILVDPEKVELTDGIGGILRYTTGSA